MNQPYHKPVMLPECLDALAVKPDGTYVDLTFGGGGHSRGILANLAAEGSLYAFDQDADAERNGKELEAQDARFHFIRGNFRHVTNHLHYLGIQKVDGILADLGVSSHQFDDGERGFSFREDAVLDMRMNQEQRLTANDILNDYDEERLADTLYIYGELKNARKMARAIVKARRDDAWTSTRLSRILEPFIPRERDKKDLAKIYQALRIEVNGEMRALGQMLTQIPDLLNPDGRFVVMTYHSLEDRMVKNFIKTGNIEGHQEKDFYGRTIAPMEQLNNKVITPPDDEITANPRSRSAKLRIAKPCKGDIFS